MKETRVLSRADQAKLERWLEASEGCAELGILICMHTGIRLGEICALCWEDISVDGRVISIRRTLQRLPVSDGERKTALVFDTPKRPELRPAGPGAHATDRPCEPKRCGPECYVLTGSVQPMEPRRFQRRFKSALKAAGGERHQLHALRHTFATNCVTQGCDPATLAEYSGTRTYPSR